LPDFGAAAVAGAAGAAGGFSTAGFSVVGSAGISAGRRATVSSERWARSWLARSTETSRAASPSAEYGSGRRIRAAWSLAAAITASLLKYRDAVTAQIGLCCLA